MAEGLRPERVLIWVTNSANDSILIGRAPTPGLYTVLVSSGELAQLGTYELHYVKIPGSSTIPARDEGGPLTSGGRHLGAIDIGDVDPWTFEANVGEEIYLRAGELSGGFFEPWLRVYDPAGALVQEINSANDSLIIYRVLVAGKHTVLVSSGELSQTGTYRLHYLKTPGASVIPDGDEGGPLTSGGRHLGAIDIGDVDPWTFEANVGDEIYLRAGELSGGFFEPWLRVYDPAGALVQEINSANDSLIIYRVLVAGKHTVLVSSGELSQTGTYRLHYLKTPGASVIPDGDEGGPLTSGGRHLGAIDIGDVDPWTFEANVGDEIYLRAGELSGGFFEPWLRVYDPAGALVQEINSANDSLIIYRVLVAGKHTVLVSSGELSQTGTYRLHYLKTPGASVIPDGDEGGPLASGGRHVGAIDIGDVDPWTFEANVGEEIYLRAGELSGGFFEPWLRVYDPAGALVQEINSANDSLIIYRVLVAGKHTVLVSSGELSQTGTYRLHYLKVPGSPLVPDGDEGGALVNGGNHDGAIDLGDMDAWTFEASAGDEIYLRAGELSGGFFEPWMRLHDPNGVLLQEVNSANDSIILQRATVGGRYTVVLASGELGQVGTYRLHYLKTPGAFVIPSGDEGGPLQNGGNQLGSISLGDMDVWTFEANQGNVIALRVKERTGGFFRPLLRVYGPTGQLLSSTSNDGLAQVTLVAPDSGVFVVLTADAAGGQTGTYEFSVDGLPEQDRRLRVSRLEKNAITLNWPATLAGSVVQSASSLEQEGWEDLGVSPVTIGLNIRVSVPIGPGRRFFRLGPSPR